MGSDLYGVLEVEPEATESQIRKAYFRLAKIYHPDRQHDEEREATERFLQIQEAYKTLTDPIRRESYDRKRMLGDEKRRPAAVSKPVEVKAAPQARRASIEEVRDARQAYMKAEELIERGDAEKALRLMIAVVRTVPDTPEYQSLYGYALALNGEKLHTARDACRRAVAAEPYNPDFQAHLGYVYQRAGLSKTAQQCYRKALELNPQHPIAAAHAESEGGGGGGLLASLKRMLGR